MKRKWLAVTIVFVVIAGVYLLPAEVLFAQGGIQLYSEHGSIPGPVYVGEISEQELNKLGCRYFPDANCPKCGVSHYRSETVDVPNKESIEAVRS